MAAVITVGAAVASASTSFDQIGSDIDGEAAGDQSGYSVAMSSDGTEVAIGAIGNDGTASGAGHVRVYEWTGSAWVQKGADINGEAANDKSGNSVAMSSDGTVVAIGAYMNDGTANNAGHVRIYEWTGNAWVQKGADIDGEAEGDLSGWSVSLSSDGTEVAIGAYLNDGTGYGAGHVRIYDWTGSAWIQTGADIDGEARLNHSGSSVSLSSDGSGVAIGAPSNSETGNGAGHVRVFSKTTSTPTTTTTVAPTTTTTTTVTPTTTTAPTTTEASTTTATPTTTDPTTTIAQTTTIVLPATGSSDGTAPQVLLMLGVGGLLVLFTRRRLKVLD